MDHMDHMGYETFLDRIVDYGIVAATADYKEGPKLSGSIKGFEACRNKTPEQIVDEWSMASGKIQQFREAPELDNYWYWNCYQLEIEWVLNCLSVFLNKPLLGHLPTARGAMKAYEVLGFQGVLG